MRSVRSIAFASATLIVAVVAFTLAALETPISYPKARVDTSVVDDFHGTKVADPYRWLEDDKSEETRAFVEANNRLTRAFLDSPRREAYRERLELMWNYPRYSAPSRVGDYYVWSKNDGLQPHSVVYMQDTLTSEPKVLFDPNTFSKDGTIALSGTSYSEDGSLVAYSVSDGGSDQRSTRIRDIKSGTDLPDTLENMRFAGIAWKHDNSGFFYNQYPYPGTVPAVDNARFSKLYFHKLGTSQKDDVLVYETPQDPDLSFGASITEDGKYLLLYGRRGTQRMNRLYYREVESTQPFIKLIDEEIASYSVVGNDGPVLYVLTDDAAPRRRLIAVDLSNPSRENWKTILAESQETLEGVSMIGDKFVVRLTRDAYSIVRLHKLDGSLHRELELPTLGSVGGISGKRTHNEFFYTFTSFAYPPTIFRYDMKTDAATVVRKSEAKVNPDDYETRQIFATSKDGTRVPLFVVHKKGVSLDGTNPTIMGGYGGFSIAQSPGFSIARIAWMDLGGVYALTCLRGGSEYGREWHRAGMLENKQNVFDDFHACAEELIRQRYTSQNRIAIQGGSNGGLLVAACMLQRPDLYGAVICQVPVIDMLRYHRMSVGRFWVPEYGNAETNAEHFKFMIKYSPLHNVKSGAKYPPILIMTGDRDDRVVPAHPFKFAATLQANADPGNIILLRTEMRTGHGAGKPTDKVINETADIHAFLMRVFEMK
jgi:prolyl oligopeptidase